MSPLLVAISPRRRTAFTLVELLVSLSVIAVLFSLLVPAVQQVRESARRAQCQSHLHQFGLALHNYHDSHQMFPAGHMRGLSLHVAILPFIDQSALYERFRRLNPDAVFYDEIWLTHMSSHRIPGYQCPSDSWADVPSIGSGLLGDSLVSYPTSYVGNAGCGVQKFGYNGVFRNAPPVRLAEITDGASNTSALSEILIGHDDNRELARALWHTPYPLLDADQLEQFAHLCRQTAQSGMTPPSPGGRRNRWTEGQVGSTMYNHVLFPNDASCYNGSKVQMGAYSAASMHHGTVNILAADGHVRAVKAIVDLAVWRALGSRDGNEALDPN